MVIAIEETLYLVKPVKSNFYRLSISVNIILSFKECFSLISSKGPKRMSLGMKTALKNRKAVRGKDVSSGVFVCHSEILAIRCQDENARVQLP